MTPETTAPSVPLGKYLLQFTGISALLSVIIAAVQTFTSFELPSSSGVIALVAAAAPAAQNFVRDQRRDMNKGERLRFAVLGTLITLAISVVLFMIMLVAEGVPLTVETLDAMLASLDVPGAVMAIIIAVAVLVSVLVLYLALGFISRGALKRLEKSGS